MKQHIFFGAALTALSIGASAQSQVTVYGTLDAGLISISNTSGGTGYLPSAVNKGSMTQLKDGGIGGSNWGFKGSEDLGGGLRATFQLQGNIKTVTGDTGGANSASATSFFNQYSTIGLAGNFGSVTLGRQVSPMYTAMASTDARAARYFGSVLTALVGLNSASGAYIGSNSNVAFGTVYNDNAVVYQSPRWAGVSVAAEYALGNAGGNANAQQALTAQYDDNGLRLSALWYNGYGNNLPAATAVMGAANAANAGFSSTANTNRLTSVGALYSWDAYTVSAAYFAARNPANVVVPGGSASLDMWSVGAGWKFAPGYNLTAGYYRMKDNTNHGNSASQFAVGLEYSMSKRTTVYAEAAAISNHGANMGLSPVYASPVATNQGVHAVMAGLRHSF